MKHNEVRRYWNANAEVWTRLSRAGYDVYRDHLNTPALLDMLPDIAGLKRLDLGCGEGYNTRLLAQRGAQLAAVELPYVALAFDLVTACMSFMNVAETERVIAEAYRLLRPDGFLQFSISHPCYDTAHRRNLRGEDGRTFAYEVGGCFEGVHGRVEEWLFSAAPSQVRAGLPPFRIPRFTRTLSLWINLLLDTGFVLERLGEPRPDDQTVQEHPSLQDAQVAADFLIVRARKPGPTIPLR